MELLYSLSSEVNFNLKKSKNQKREKMAQISIQYRLPKLLNQPPKLPKLRFQTVFKKISAILIENGNFLSKLY